MPGHLYTFLMGTPLPVKPLTVGILILDDDAQSSHTLRQILDFEGWLVRFVPNARLLLEELKTGEWSLVLADVALIGLHSPAFVTLRELAGVSAEDGGRVRVLYLVPEAAGTQDISTLELDRLPYVVRPYQLHDILEKVSDLLVEVKAISAPIRQVRYEFGGHRKKRKDASRNNTMFASRDSYSYSDEELVQYERDEKESSKNKRPKNIKDLGNPNR